MRFLNIAILLIVLPVVASAQGKSEVFFEYINADASARIWFTELTEKLDRKYKEGDEAFAKKVFYHIQNKYLKHYSKYASFEELMHDGKYDCLSGTILYALVLDHYRIPYKINEGIGHINLTLEVNGRSFLFEATDPINGFTSASNTEDSPANLSMKQLAGLLFYNNAVRFNNLEQFQLAYQSMLQAESMYPTNRISSERSLIEQNLAIYIISNQ